MTINKRYEQKSSYNKENSKQKKKNDTFLRKEKRQKKFITSNDMGIMFTIFNMYNSSPFRI